VKRRGLFALGVAAVALLLTPKRARAAKKIRPPGAQPPGKFETACIGCYRCAEVCPPRCILFGPTLGLDAPTPYLDLKARACTLCMKCTQVCPTDALAPIAVDAAVVAKEVRMGAPVLDRKKCLPWNATGSCSLCFQVCPYPDKAVELVGIAAGPLFHAEACVGCGLCEEACPDEAHAIRIVPGEPK
jgi:ferredoxin-type protein NapG